MPEPITKTCPLCGKLAVRVCTGAQVVDRNGETVGWGTKYVCFADTERGAGHWQETGPLSRENIPESHVKHLWAMINDVAAFGLAVVPGRSAAVAAERQKRFDDMAVPEPRSPLRG